MNNDDYDFMDDTPKPRSTSKWIVIIASGVLIGNILSFAAYEAYTFLKWKFILETATTELNKYSSELKQRSSTQQKQLRQQSITRQNELKRQRVERQKQTRATNATKAQLKKTCDFWNQQIKTSNNASNRSNRDLACQRYRNYRG